MFIHCILYQWLSSIPGRLEDWTGRDSCKAWILYKASIAKPGLTAGPRVTGIKPILEIFRDHSERWGFP